MLAVTLSCKPYAIFMVGQSGSLRAALGRVVVDKRYTNLSQVMPISNNPDINLVLNGTCQDVPF